MIPNPYSSRPKTVLDDVPERIAAYSCNRRLFTNYNGPALRVRRDSDDAEQDIGFLTNGKLNVKQLNDFLAGGPPLQTFNILNARFTDNSLSTAPTGTPQGIVWNSDKTRLYIIDSGVRNVVDQFDVAHPGDPFSAVYNGVSLPTGNSGGTDIFLSPDGHELMILVNAANAVLQHHLDVKDDISPATTNLVFTFLIGDQETIPHAMTFSRTTGKFWVIGNAQSIIFEYNATTPYQLSTASFVDQSLPLGGLDGDFRGMALAPDGLSVILLGIVNDMIYQLTMSVFEDITTIFGGITQIDFDLDTQCFGMSVAEDGISMLFVGNQNDALYQATLSPAFVTILYDQTGNGFDVSIGLIGQEPILENDGFYNDGLFDIVRTTSGFASTKTLPATTDTVFAFSVSSKRDFLSSGTLWNLINVSTANRVFVHLPFRTTGGGAIFWDAGNTGTRRLATAIGDLNTEDLLQHTISVTPGTNNQQIRSNGVLLAARTPAAGAVPLERVTLLPSVMRLREIFFFLSNRTADVVAIEDDQKVFNNILPLPTVALSLRKIVPGYAGPAVQIRRSSDNTLLDIGFTPEGDFDEDAFTAFVGAGDGFVRTWYDQTLSFDAVETINANQPQLVLKLFGGRAGLSFFNSNLTLGDIGWLATLQDRFLFTVINPTAGRANNELIGNLTQEMIDFGTNTGNDDVRWRNNGTNSESTTPDFPYGVKAQFTTKGGNDIVEGWRNGVPLVVDLPLVSSFSWATGANFGLGLQGITDAGREYRGGIAEVKLYSDDVSTNMTALESDQLRYYGVV